MKILGVLCARTDVGGIAEARAIPASAMICEWGRWNTTTLRPVKCRFLCLVTRRPKGKAAICRTIVDVLMHQITIQVERIQNPVHHLLI